VVNKSTKKKIKRRKSSQQGCRGKEFGGRLDGSGMRCWQRDTKTIIWKKTNWKKRESEPTLTNEKETNIRMNKYRSEFKEMEGRTGSFQGADIGRDLGPQNKLD